MSGPLTLPARGVWQSSPTLDTVVMTGIAFVDVDTRLLEIDPSAYSYLTRAKPWLAQLFCHAVSFAYANRLSEMLGNAREQL